MDKTEKTISAYNKYSQEFANKFMDFELYSERVKEFYELLNVKDSILDLGCGPGNVSKQLLSYGKEFSIIGVDLSEEMVKLAQQNVPNANFSCHDIRNINFEEESFHAIIMSFCIVHLTGDEMILLIKKVSKYLKKNGKVFLSFMQGDNEIFETTSFSNEEIYFKFYMSSEVERILKDNGISTLKTIKQEYPELDGTLTTDVFIFGEKQ